MDHAVLIGKNVHEHSSALGHKENNSSIRKLGEWQNALKELMINIRIRDAKRIEEARTDLKRIQNDLKEHERNLFQSEKKHSWMLVELSVSESIRRLCAYARDFGESLINMNAYKGIRQDTKGVHRHI
jgi:CRISPR/Cas system CMR-associated protein Cmr1 (group 7 of RAMP superfamily)